MATGLLLFIGGIFVIIAGFIFKNKYKLYKTGKIAQAKVVELETYSYVTPGPEYGLIYHTGYTPIIEIDENGNKKTIKYYCEGQIKVYKEGDVFPIIYPEGDLEDLEEYSKYGLYKLPSVIAAFGIMLIVVSIALIFI